MSQLTDLQKRFIDLYEQSLRNTQYTFTRFLNEADYAELLMLGKEIPQEAFTAFGGYPSASRVMVRFGNPDEFGYETAFPVTVLKMEPLQKKFADDLSHRDFLGALMNLGIERSELGDILVGDREAHLICTDKMADYIADNLTRIRYTGIRVIRTEELPQEITPKLEEAQVQVASQRIDLFVSKICKLSRKECAEYFSGKKIFLNGRLMENHSRQLATGDVISVRGFGKFRYIGPVKTTRSGNLIVAYEHYV